MNVPEFKPVLPTGYQYAVTMVRHMGRNRYLVVYDAWSDDGYREQRCACIVGHHVKWDQIVWADSGGVYYKEGRQQKIERVRLKPLRRRNW